MLARTCYLATLAASMLWGMPAWADAAAARPQAERAGSERAFDPSEYLKQRGFENAESAASLRHGLVVVDGVVFRRFETSDGAIIVPMTAALRPDDLLQARCLRDGDAPYSEAEPGSDRDAKARTEIARRSDAIKAAIKAKCGSAPRADAGFRPATPAHGTLDGLALLAEEVYWLSHWSDRKVVLPLMAP